VGQVTCVLFKKLPKIRRHFRRFSFSNEHKCTGSPGQNSYCNAWVFRDIIEYHSDIIEVQDQPPHDDPRWPSKCEKCDYVFTDADNWQIFCDWIYQNTDTGEEVAFRDLPVGAMYDSDWYPPDYRGPDGLALTVILPDKTPWVIDGYASGPPRVPHAWTRTGIPPKVSASPSILTPGYHGWLKDGVLTDC
jgi:hypothetical protein